MLACHLHPSIAVNEAVNDNKVYTSKLSQDQNLNGSQLTRTSSDTVMHIAT
jgi:hypothetical protein